MRLLVIVLACCPLLMALPAVAEQPFPYKARVAAEDVYVRSGPGTNYYPTDKLKIEQEVEVYRHDPGGWCAIRPVDSSFTWVSGRYLKAADHNLAVVTEDNVQARVGSRLSDVRDVVQVRLRKGEFVELVDAASRAKLGENAWIKIAPPAGEFRWIAGKYLDQQTPHNAVRRPHAAGPDDRPPPGQPGVADREPGPGPRRLSPRAYETELERLDLELSAMVIEEPATWSFDSLRDRANSLLDQAQTAVERGRARMLAGKIARFEDLKQRADAVRAMHEDTDRSARLLTGLRYKTIGNQGSHRPDIDDRFDGVGQLTMVKSPKVGAPRYALIDEAGDVRCYVTPTPGVNLHGYIGKQVGITGSRGYMPEQRASHLMARHVTALNDNPMLR